jgi:lactate dehydrogenase-like 2-hydroxyacid dehydrogenase
MSGRPVVLVGRKLPDAVEARLARDYEPRLNPDDRLYTGEELIAMAEGASAILPCHTEHLSADMIARLPASVRAICNFSVGVDHCDLAAARERGIIVTNTPDVLSDATAEIAILLMLGAARRASEGERLVRSATWKDWSPSFMVGRQVTGKRLGVVGMGRVGQVVARRPPAPRSGRRGRRQVSRVPGLPARRLGRAVAQLSGDAGVPGPVECRAHRQAAVRGDRHQHGARRLGE